MMLMPVLMSGVAYVFTRIAVHPDHGRRHADDDAGQRERVAAPDEEAVRRAGRRLPEAPRHTSRPRRRPRSSASAAPGAATSPTPRRVLLFATGPRARLWERRPLGPRLPAPAHRHRRPALRRDHQGPGARRPRGSVAVDRTRTCRSPSPCARSGVAGIAGQPDECSVGRDVGGGPGRGAAQPVGRDRGGAAGQRAQPRLGLGEVAAARPHRRGPPAAGAARDRRGHTGRR